MVSWCDRNNIEITNIYKISRQNCDFHKIRKRQNISGDQNTKLEVVFYMKTDVSPLIGDAVLYRMSGFGIAKGYKLRK